jgi:putative ABC transport system permease protein
MLRAAWKSLLGRKMRLVMSLFAITIGVGFVVGSYVFSDTLNKSFTGIFNNSVPDVSVRYGKDDDRVRRQKAVPQSLVDTLSKLPGAATVHGRVRGGGVVLLDRDNKVVGSMGPPTFAFNDVDAPAARGVRGVELLAGSHPRGKHEIILDQDSAARAGYYIGDQVHLVIPGSAKVATAELVGLSGVREGSLNGATIIMWDTKSMQRLFHDGKQVYDSVWLSTAPGVTQGELKAEVEKVLPVGYSAKTGDAAAKEAATALQEVLKFITTFLLVVAGIALVVGSFLIINTFSILVAQRSRELALLRALGASKRQVTTSVLIEAFVVGLVGSTLGSGFGLVVAWAIRTGAKAMSGLDIGATDFVLEPRTFLIAYAVGLLVTMTAAWLPARRSAKIAPVQALRDDVALPSSSLRLRLLGGVLLGLVAAGLIWAGLTQDVPKAALWVGGGVLAALMAAALASPVIAQPFLALTATLYRVTLGEVGRIAGQNSLRNPRRTAATASALMIGLSLVTTMSIIGSSASASVDATVADSFRSDLVITDVTGRGFSPRIAKKVSAVDGVADVVSSRFGVAQLGKDREFIAGVDPANLGKSFKIDVDKGSPTWAKNHCVLNKDTAKANDLAVGDTVQFRTPSGRRAYVVDATYTANATLWSTCLLSLETFEAAGYDKLDSALFLTLDPSSERRVVKDAVAKKISSLPTVSVLDQAGFAAKQRAPIDQMVSMINMLLGLALVIAVLGIVNTLGLSVIERTREIGLLRAIGLNRPQLRRMIGLEAIVIAVLGALLGVGMGVVFGWAIVTSLKDQGLTLLSVPTSTLGWFVVGAAIIGVLAALLPAYRASRIDVLKAIATE